MSDQTRELEKCTAVPVAGSPITNVAVDHEEPRSIETSETQDHDCPMLLQRKVMHS